MDTLDQPNAALGRASDRRSFLRKLAGGGAAAVVVSGCDFLFPNPTPIPGPGPAPVRGVNLGGGDIGVLNYAYALEQLEAAFYTKILNGGFYSGATDHEKRVLEAIREHEVAHRDFLAAALGSAAIAKLSFDFSGVEFKSRESVLGTARVFEDLGVSAYNGAGQLLTNPDFLVVAGKIVSVEARHAAAIRDLLQPLSTYFAGDDVVDENGLDVVNPPRHVLAAAAPFILNEINANGLPRA